MIYGRCAHLTESKPIYEAGQGLCASRNVVSGAVLLEAILMPIPLDTLGMKTGNLTLKTDSVVHSIIYDQDQKKAVGVRVIDAHTKSQPNILPKSFS